MFLLVSVAPYIINLSNNGPVVLGATITFNCELLNDDGSPPSGTFRFYWQDNAIPQNSAEVSAEINESYYKNRLCVYIYCWFLNQITASFIVS